jgi:NAD(P) transhydrogenase subunit alpha
MIAAVTLPITDIAIFVLAVFIGFEVIVKVPTLLHTPLMSGTNAIHGVVLVGAILVLGSDHAADNTPIQILGFIAVVFGTLNVVGGFVVTDRMLEMFKEKPTQKANADSNGKGA